MFVWDQNVVLDKQGAVGCDTECCACKLHNIGHLLIETMEQLLPDNLRTHRHMSK